MRKISIYLAAATLLLTMTACGDKTDAGDVSDTSGTSEIKQESTENTGSAENTGEAPSFEEGGWSEEMTQIKNAVVDALGENYWPDMQLDPDMLDTNYGISADMYEDYLAEIPMISGNVDTLLIIKAKSDTVDEVEDILHDYHDTQVNDALQYPMNIGKVQAARVERIDNYVCYVQLGAGAIDLEDTNTVVEQCREQNELVIEIIRQSLQDK